MTITTAHSSISRLLLSSLEIQRTNKIKVIKSLTHEINTYKQPPESPFVAIIQKQDLSTHKLDLLILEQRIAHGGYAS